MNLVNKVLILLIIIFLINYLTDGKIFKTIKRYFSICVEKMINNTSSQSNIDIDENFTSQERFEPLYFDKSKNNTSKENCDLLSFARSKSNTSKENSARSRSKSNTQEMPYIGQLDFPDANHSYPEMNSLDELDPESYNLYKFINSRVTKNSYNYEMTADREESYEVPEDMYNYILKSLRNMFNSSGYNFTNIKILDKLVYYENNKGKDIIPFKFSADITNNSSGKVQNMGSVIVYIESFIYEKIKGGAFSILNVRLIDRKNPNQKEKKSIKSIYKVTLDSKIENKKLNDNMTESFNNLFIPVKNNDDDDDIDIPSVKFTDIYEEASVNQTSDEL